MPFVSKTTGVPLASLAAAIMTGATLDELGLHDDVLQPYVAVKEAVFPFSKLPGVDLILGPEMRSTGEVMGIADSFGMAFAKAQISADGALPLSGSIFVTVNDHDKANVVPIVRRFHGLGFRVFATEGTARYLRARGVPAERVLKVHEGRPNAIDLLVSGQIQLLINTPLGKLSQQDDYAIRQAALQHRVPYTTTLSGASAASRRDHRAPEPGRRGAAAPGVACAGAGDVARMDRVTARDPGFAAAAARRSCVARSGRTRRWRGTRPIGSAGRPPSCFRRRRRTWRSRSAPRTMAGVPWFAVGLGSNILLPDEGLDALVIRLGKGLDALIRRASAGRSERDCRRRSRPGRPRRRASRGSTSSSACRARWAGACT